MVTTLANSLVHTYDVHIITFINIPPFYDLDRRVKIINCFNKIDPSSNPLQALKSNYSLLRRIHGIIKENKIELLIGFMTTANVLATVIGKINSIPVIISERNNPEKQNLSKFWEISRKFTYRYADYLVVQTPIIKNYFINTVDENRLKVLPNPISSQLSSLRKRTCENENIILNVGSLTNQKAQHVLIESFAKINTPSWKLIIVGDGPRRKELTILIEQLNLVENILLVGQQKNIHEYYNKAKIFAFSSTYEGFPNALIEAMHFGLPCVSTDCPTGPAELIQDGQNGFLVPINDIKEMSFKLGSLMANPAKIKGFGEKGVLSVQQYEEKNVIKQWNKIINTLIG